MNKVDPLAAISDSSCEMRLILRSIQTILVLKRCPNLRAFYVYLRYCSWRRNGITTRPRLWFIRDFWGATHITVFPSDARSLSQSESPSTILMSFSVLVAVLAIFSVVVFVRRRSLAKQRNCSLPPGPPGWPIVGNLFDLTEERPWLVYSEWSKQYGMSYGR